MKKFTSMILACAFAGMLALGAGCASSGASASSGAAASSQAASAEVSASQASASDAASAVAAPVDPANLAAGEYQVAVSLAGGSGKATVESPAKLIVADDGAMTAVIVWSSPNYDLMVVDGQEYAPVPRAGNSTFEVPVSAFDQDLAIQAETTAMSEPHMIDYTLNFDSSTLEAL